MKKPTNIDVSNYLPPEGKTFKGCACVSWELDNARFHIWIRPAQPGHIDENTLYKNPLRVNTKTTDPDYFETRKLDVTSKSNAKIIADVMRTVNENSLIDVARRRYEAKQAARQAENVALNKHQRMHAAAPALFAALDRIICDHDLFNLVVNGHLLDDKTRAEMEKSLLAKLPGFYEKGRSAINAAQ